MDYYFDVCDKSITIKSKSKQLSSLTHNELEKCIRINNAIKTPDFFEVDQIFNEEVTNHKKKFNLFLVKYVVFDGKFYPHIKNEFQLTNQNVILKRFFYFRLNILEKEDTNCLIFLKWILELLAIKNICLIKFILNSQCKRLSWT